MDTRIIKVEVSNFRNISHLVLDINKDTSIITGKNKLGKSNLLNAVNWLITDTLLTDKYGVGENDIESIVPNTHLRGEHTEVTITLSNNATYTKIYKVGYTSDGSKINKHSTEYKRNGVGIATQKEFYSSLYEQFGFTPAFTSLKINEVRLMTNPLYALLIIDSKELRKLLVAMGCTVSNEELYQMGFEYMRPLEEQYQGRWEDVRKKASDDLRQRKNEMELHQAQLKLFNHISDELYEHALTKVNELKGQRETLVEKRKEINSSGVNSLVRELQLQIQETRANEQALINSRNLELDTQIRALQEKINDTEKAANILYQESTKNIREQIDKIKSELIDIHKEYQEVSDERYKTVLEINAAEHNRMHNSNKIGELSDTLAHLLDPTNEIECPYCHATFVNISNGESSVDEIRSKIEKLQQSINDYDDTISNLKKSLESIDYKLSTNDDKSKKTKEVLVGLENELKNYSLPVINASETNAKIRELEQEKLKPLDGSKLPELQARLNELASNSAETQRKEIEAINNEIVKIDELANAANITINDYERKQQLQSAIGHDQAEINTAENWLQQVNKFIQTMINKINQRAKEITGFDFVMLEENLTNGNLTEVCYALVDNVPFKDLNTADKFKYGIKFLEVCRKVAANKTGVENSLPILADRFESIALVSTIKEYTDKQLICTRVNTNNEMRVE